MGPGTSVALLNALRESPRYLFSHVHSSYAFAQPSQTPFTIGRPHLQGVQPQVLHIFVTPFLSPSERGDAPTIENHLACPPPSRPFSRECPCPFDMTLLSYLIAGLASQTRRTRTGRAGRFDLSMFQLRMLERETKRMADLASWTGPLKKRYTTSTETPHQKNVYQG